MTALPPHVQAAVDEIVACAPPLTPGQERLIRRALGPYVPAQDMKRAQAAPQAA